MATDSAPKLTGLTMAGFSPRTNACLQGERGHRTQSFIHRQDQLQQEVFALAGGRCRCSTVSRMATCGREITASLVGGLCAGASPSDRPVHQAFQTFEAAEDALNSGKAEWSDSEDLAFEDEPDPYRVNMLLAFYNQMRWLHEMFKDEPGVSISVR